MDNKNTIAVTGNAISRPVLFGAPSAELDVPEPVGKDMERVLDVVGP